MFRRRRVCFFMEMVPPHPFNPIGSATYYVTCFLGYSSPGFSLLFRRHLCYVHSAVTVDIHCFPFVCFISLVGCFRIIINYQTLVVDVIHNPISRLVIRDVKTMHGPLFSYMKYLLSLRVFYPSRLQRGFTSDVILLMVRQHPWCTPHWREKGP